MLFGFPAVLGIIFFLIYAIAASILGATTGLFTRLALRQALSGTIWDALIGASGFAVGFVICIIVPWPENTITYYIGETKVQSTMNGFQFPSMWHILSPECCHWFAVSYAEFDLSEKR
jgi:hypothetical protein